jgi:hypothetical protein
MPAARNRKKRPDEEIARTSEEYATMATYELRKYFRQLGVASSTQKPDRLQSTI